MTISGTTHVSALIYSLKENYPSNKLKIGALLLAPFFWTRKGGIRDSSTAFQITLLSTQ